MTGPDLDLPAMQGAAERACRLLKALSNPDRLMVLCRLSQGELTVGEIEAALGIRQPTLSQQLTVLREHGLVATRREGKNIHYRLADDDAMAVIRVLYERYCPRGA